MNKRKQYSIAFRGEIVAGRPVDQVKALFGERFSKTPETVDRIFGGEVKTLAKDLDYRKANALANSLAAIGAVVYVVDNDDPVMPLGRSGHAAGAANEPVVDGSAEPAATVRYQALPDAAERAESGPTKAEDTAIEEQGDFDDEPHTATIVEEARDPLDDPDHTGTIVEERRERPDDASHIVTALDVTESFADDEPFARTIVEEPLPETGAAAMPVQMPEPMPGSSRDAAPRTEAPGAQPQSTGAPASAPATPATDAGAATEPGSAGSTAAPGETTDLSPTAKVRHLSQIMDRDDAPAPRRRVARSQRMRYRFDTFMARGGPSIFKMLTAVFIAAFLVIGAARGLLIWYAPELAVQNEDLGVLGNLYLTFLELTDPGNMVQDLTSSPWYKVFAIAAGLAGIVMLSALIAFITTSLDQKINDLKRGRSKVIEDGHTLILGWNEQRIVEIIQELILANESEKDACVVILADKDKEEIDDILRLRIKDRRTTRIVTRSGDVSTLANLDMVSIETAKSVIILAACDDTDSAESKAGSDAKGIQTVLATIGRAADDDDFSVVVEIFNPTHREIVQSSFPEHVVTVNTSDILAKLLVQTSRSVGLSVVYNEILSFDGCEMYFYSADWGGASFGEAAFRFPDGVPIGLRRADGEIVMNPSPDRVIEESDEVLIIADDDSTIEFRATPVAEPRELTLTNARGEQRVERELMIGWNFKSPNILREFADYIVAGSRIDVLLKTPTERQRREIEAVDAELDNIEVRLVEKDCLNLADLMSLKPFTYDNIIILAASDDSGAGVDTGRVDSENIVALLLLRRIFSQYPDESRDTKLITEILDSQNYPLVARAGVQDVIISNRLVSMIMAQISESRDIEKVYDDIFQEDGSEIYLKQATLYFHELPVEASFADLMRLAQKRDEVCIGVRTKALEHNKEANNGVELIPDKNKVFTLKPEDSLVVVAADEL